MLYYLFITLTTLLSPLLSVRGEINSNPLIPIHEKIKTTKNYLPTKPIELLEDEVLHQYLSYWEEGKNLINRCDSNQPWSEKLGTFEREKLLLTMMATYQFLGVDLTARAIVEYIRTLQLSSQHKKTLWKNLIGQYCSPNMTVISRKELMKKFERWDRHGSGFLLPDITTFQHFPTFIPYNHSDLVKKELQQTIALFRSFCSWGGNIKYARLLNFIFQDPHFSALVIRTLGGKDIHYDRSQKKSILKTSQEPFSMNCQNSFCRRTYKDLSTQSLPLMEDLYCRYLWATKTRVNPRHKILSKWVDETSPKQVHLMHGQLTALVTGIPEFMLKIKDSNDYLQFLKSSHRSSWNKWAIASLKRLSQNLPYEESLSLTALDHQPSPNPQKLKLEIKFQVIVGEFDKMLLQKDKLQVSYPIKISGSILKWAKTHQESQTQKVKKVLHRQIANQVAEMEKKFILHPWQQDITKLIVDSLLPQLKEYQGDFSRDIPVGGQVKIPIHLAYGPFALKYIHFRRKY